MTNESSTEEATAPKRFRLLRDDDETGVSGTGEVAQGVLFSDGWFALHWIREPARMTTVYNDLDRMIQVHGHGGKTRIDFIDP